MNAPKLSVVVPAYNLEQYIAQCLDSIAAQTLKDFECIVVNDGSTDKTKQIIAKYPAKDARFVVINKTNGGVSTARNAGLDAARGEYVMFLDGDDFFDPRLLEMLHGAIAKQHADIAVCNFKAFYASMQKYSDPKINFKILHDKHNISYETAPDVIFEALTLMFWNKLFRTDFLRANGLRNDVGLRRAQDIDFVARALVDARNIVVVDECLVYYRTDTGTSNVSGLYKHPHDVVQALSNVHRYLESKGLYGRLEKSYVKVAVGHILANLYFTETHAVHKQVYREAKKFLAGLHLERLAGHDLGDEKAAKEVHVLLQEDYEGWLHYRISDLRDDREAKYISYLLSEYQRKYDEEAKRYAQEHELRLNIERSLSWRITRPLRAVMHLARRQPRP